jgi:fructokinase
VVTVIVVAGEALIDLVGEPDGRFRALPGGSPANVAVGLARLGNDTQLLARLGNDRFGQTVRSHLRANAVGLAHTVAADSPTTLAVATSDGAGQVTYDFYLEGTADWGWRTAELPKTLPADAVALCTRSMALAVEPGASSLTDFVEREYRRGEVTVVVDPNVRPAVFASPAAARARIEALLGIVDVVKVSDQDLDWLAPGEPVDAVVAHWLTRGPQVAVVTLGGRGAYAATSMGIETRVSALPVKVVDTVGAGDAFTSGLVDGMRRRGLLGGRSSRADRATLTAPELTEIVTYASRVAALTCARQGADPPTERELADNRASDLRVQQTQGDTEQ